MVRTVDADVVRSRFHAKRVQEAMVVVRIAVAFVDRDVDFVGTFDEIEVVDRERHLAVAEHPLGRQLFEPRVGAVTTDAVRVEQPDAARPESSQSASSQNRSTSVSECVTRRIVFPLRLNSANLSRHLCVKPSSPTASTSSTSRTSGSTWIATAKPSRMYMPDEYVFTGASMNSRSSANSTISSKRSWIS